MLFLLCAYNNVPSHANISVYCSLLSRRRLDYGLTTDPNTEVSDQELTSIIMLIRQDSPYSGVSMVCGSLRARGIKVTRERVRSTLRSIDPLSVALRWPGGATKRRPYSVAGPNSLWHIGMSIYILLWQSLTCNTDGISG